MGGRGRGSFKSKNPEVRFGNIQVVKPIQNLANLPGPRSSVHKDKQKFDELIQRISHINMQDDGILANQKNKYIIENLESDCNSEEDVEEALHVVHERALQDVAFASKLVNMFSSHEFNTLEIKNMKLRNLFVSMLQRDFDNAKEMQTNNPDAFRNAVRMLGEYYHKAKLRTGQPIAFFASPLLKYLDMLLESAQEEDLQLFAIQLYMNGNGIKSYLPQKLNEILLQIRNLLANNDQLSAKSKLWLLLAVDVSNHRFGLLPNDLQAFYVAQLGDEAMTHFQKMSTELTIQTIHKNELLDKISSNVNVLKVDNQMANNWDPNYSVMGGGDCYAVDHSFSKLGYENHDGPKPSYGREKYLAKAQTYKKISPDDAAIANFNSWDSASKKENGPRPILGSGARLNKNSEKKATASDDANWRERGSGDDWRTDAKSEQNAAGWEKQPKSTSGSGWGNNDSNSNIPGGGKSNKWSQHDDRTETDYTNS